jgi:hypothetical protein
MTHLTSQAAHAPARGDHANAKGLSRFLVVAVILLAAGVTFVPFDRGDRHPAGSKVPLASAPSTTPGHADGSVPSASDVFTGHEPRGEGSPTF